MDADVLEERMRPMIALLRQFAPEDFCREALNCAAEGNEKGFFPAYGPIARALRAVKEERFRRQREERLLALPPPAPPLPRRKPSPEEVAAVKAAVQQFRINVNSDGTVH